LGNSAKSGKKWELSATFRVINVVVQRGKLAEGGVFSDDHHALQSKFQGWIFLATIKPMPELVSGFPFSASNKARSLLAG